MYHIDDDLKEFVESGLAILVGTGSNGHPHVTPGWSPRVHGDGTTFDVFLDTARSAAPLADLKANPNIAVTVADPVSYRSVQFKGAYVDTNELDQTDMDWVRRGREAFVAATSIIGDPPELVRSQWLEETVRVTFRVEKAFNQTPGPEAGKPL